MKRLLLSLVLALNAAGLQGLAAATTSGSGPSPAPRKVLIEAAIVELALDGEKALDLHLPSATPFAFGPTKAGNGGGNGFGSAAKLTDNWEATLRALSRDRRVKILQRPRIETADGVAACLFVGQSLPAPRHVEAESAGSKVVCGQAQPGVTLEVAPAIQGPLVTMDLRLRVVRLGKEIMLKDLGPVPVTTSTEARAKIQVHDHETILLSGLRQAEREEAAPVRGFPKELPIPSAASSGGSARWKQTELMLLLRPTLLAADK